MYGLRRGFATQVGQNLSAGMAKFHLGHDPNSSMFARTYDQAHSAVNLTEGLLGVEDSRLSVPDALTLTR